MENVCFKDRIDAGKQLAEKLIQYKDQSPVVLALPRGGVVLGAEIAGSLDCALDLVIPRKIGHPANPEYAIAAVTESGALVVNEAEVGAVDPTWFEREKEAQITEAKRRRKVYLKGRKSIDLTGKTAILADDGIATGLTMQAAIREVEGKNPAKIVVAVPVAPHDIYEKIRAEVDDFAAIDVPDSFLGSVGAYYRDFPQVSDEEVVKILQQAKS